MAMNSDELADPETWSTEDEVHLLQCTLNNKPVGKYKFRSRQQCSVHVVLIAFSNWKVSTNTFECLSYGIISRQLQRRIPRQTQYGGNYTHGIIERIWYD